MVIIKLKNGQLVEIPKAEEAQFVYLDELQVKSHNYSSEILARFQTSEVAGFWFKDDPAPAKAEGK